METQVPRLLPSGHAARCVATAIYNDAYGRDPSFFDFYRSMQALGNGLTGDTTTYVGPATGDFFRYFGVETGKTPPSGSPAPSQ